MRLFPRLTDVLGARVMASLPEEEWAALLLVASADVFPVYFQLAVPKGAISNADLQSKLEHFGDTNQFAATLLELARDSAPDAPARLQAFLQRLEMHIGESASRDELEAAMRAVFQAADDLLRREESGRMDLDMQQHLRRVVRRLLLEVEQTERVSLLEEALGGGGSIATVTDVVIMLGQQHGKYGGEWTEGAETLVTLSQLAQVENMALTAFAMRRDRHPAGGAEVAGGTDLLGDLEPGRVPSLGAAGDRRPTKAWSRSCSRSCARPALRAPAPAARGLKTGSITAGCDRSSSRADRRSRSQLAETPERSEQERQLMRRFVLDHELLQQATSADYSEGEDAATPTATPPDQAPDLGRRGFAVS